MTQIWYYRSLVPLHRSTIQYLAYSMCFVTRSSTYIKNNTSKLSSSCHHRHTLIMSMSLAIVIAMCAEASAFADMIEGTQLSETG